MLFSDVWSENAALFERLMEIYSNPPILYYGFKLLVHVHDHFNVYIDFCKRFHHIIKMFLLLPRAYVCM